MAHDDPDPSDDDADLVKRMHEDAALLATRMNAVARRIQSATASVSDRFAAADQKAQAILEAMQAPISQSQRYLKANPVADVYTLNRLLARAGELEASRAIQDAIRERQAHAGRQTHTKRLAQFKNLVFECWQAWAANRAAYKSREKFAEDMFEKWAGDPRRRASVRVVKKWVRDWESGDRP